MDGKKLGFAQSAKVKVLENFVILVEHNAADHNVISEREIHNKPLTGMNEGGGKISPDKGLMMG